MERVWKVIGVGVRLIGRSLWLSTVVVLPLFGMWLASSLAAYANASRWLALGLGLLLFPIVPVGWDLVFRWRMRRRPERTPILTPTDRVVLRTLLVNLVFVGGLLWQRPVAVYKALSVRGDWMLDGHDGPTATWLRARLFTVAEWLRRGWSPSDGQPDYGRSDRPPPPPAPSASPAPVEPAADLEAEPPDAGVATLDDAGVGAPTADGAADAGPSPASPLVDSAAEPVGAPAAGVPRAWPLPARVDPIVTAMSAADGASIEAIGAYLAARVPDVPARIKAVHDVVVRRVSYDDAAAAAITAGRFADVPSMQAEAVLARGTAVCEGYARLMAAIGGAAGLEIAYVAGVARGDQTPGDRGDDAARLEGNGHAWNAARIGDAWYPIDATWDDGGDTYGTTYLFTPPEVFVRDHLPDEPGWQLLAAPLSVAEFLRQPATNAAFAVHRLTLRAPTRSQVSAEGALAIVIDNPHQVDVLASVAPASAAVDDHATSRDCGYASSDRTVRLRCRLGDGAWRVDLWASRRGARALDYAGSIWVNSR